jgi:uncharacterized repeat protein (TIGR03803 family)
MKSANRLSVWLLLTLVRLIAPRASADVAFTTLVSFDGTNGSTPISIIQATDGNFYGTTSYGGAANQGTAFRMTPGVALRT